MRQGPSRISPCDLEPAEVAGARVALEDLGRPVGRLVVGRDDEVDTGVRVEYLELVVDDRDCEPLDLRPFPPVRATTSWRSVFYTCGVETARPLPIVNSLRTDDLGHESLGEFGVVIPTKEAHLHWVRGTCASIRHFMGDTPICVLLDGTRVPHDLRDTPGISRAPHR